MQSLPLLYGWIVMVATNPLARNILVDVSWRVALVLACAAAAEYGLRSAMRRPIRQPGRPGTAHPTRIGRFNVTGSERSTMSAKDDDAGVSASGESGEAQAVAPAEAVDIEALVPRGLRPSAWTLLKRVPLVLARLVLELVPVLGIVLVGHLIAGSSLGGQTISRLIILAVVDAYAICSRVVVPRAHAAVA